MPSLSHCAGELNLFTSTLASLTQRVTISNSRVEVGDKLDTILALLKQGWLQ